MLLGTAAVLPLLVAGCAGQHKDKTQQKFEEDVIPATKVIDFHVAPCETLWALDDSATLENSLYWLRAMDCAERMNNAQASYQATQIDATGWANVFKQSILVASTDPNLAQRRELLNNVNAYRGQMPGAIRPLLQLWRERQTLQVALEDEKARDARMQAVNEAKLQEMTAQQQELQSSLDDTRRKLENLTDIERQLSSRKQMQSDTPDIHDQETK